MTLPVAAEPLATLSDRSLDGRWWLRLHADRLEFEFARAFVGRGTLQIPVAALHPVYGMGRQRLPPFWAGVWMALGACASFALFSWFQDAFSPAKLHWLVPLLHAVIALSGVAIALQHRRVVSVAYFNFATGPQAVSFTSNGEGEAAFAAFVAALQVAIEHARGLGPTTEWS